MSHESSLSRQSSWKLRKREIPQDRRSLMAGQEVEENEDIYSNASFTDDEDLHNKDYKEPCENELLSAAHMLSVEREQTPVASKVDFNLLHWKLGSRFDIHIEHTGEETWKTAGWKCLSFLTKLKLSPPHCMFTRKSYSMYCIPPSNRLRQKAYQLVSSKPFDYIILLIIFANCITIAMERPSLKEGTQERNVLEVFNYAFTIIFTVEMLLKVIASGLYVGRAAYLKSGWNVLDGFLVLTSLLDILMMLASSGSPKILGILRVFRLLRALRPLRVISRAPGLKLVVQTLISSLKPIGNIVFICLAFFIIFGILGVQMFKGKFFYCVSADLRNITTKQECINASQHNRWVNHRYNFDDLGKALMSLFVLSSKDGWVEIMYHGLDAVGVDKQPIENYNPWMLIYFISFLLIVGFFVINMFVGVVVENFHRCREEHELQEKIKKEERQRKKEERRTLQKQRKALKNSKSQSSFANSSAKFSQAHQSIKNGFKRHVTEKFRKTNLQTRKHDDKVYFNSYSRPRKFIHDVCLSNKFELGVSIVIGINILTMGVEHYQQPKIFDDVLRNANYFFTAVFIVEAALKIIALGPHRYFRDKWNQLDMIIVVLSVVGIVIEALNTGDTKLPINPTIIRVMRVLRIARVLKLLKVSKGIRSLLETVACALPQVGNLGMLFLLLFFIFAALGVELFGTIQCTDDHPCEGLNRHASFSHFGIALLTLFRISTGDNWNGIMKDTLRDDCNPASNCSVNCCVSGIISPLYFVVFVMMAQFVLVNVVVAVLMKHLDENTRASSDGSGSDVDGEDQADEEENENDDKVDYTVPEKQCSETEFVNEITKEQSAIVYKTISVQPQPAPYQPELSEIIVKPVKPLEVLSPRITEITNQKQAHSSLPCLKNPVGLLPPPPFTRTRRRSHSPVLSTMHKSGCSSLNVTPRHSLLPEATNISKTNSNQSLNNNNSIDLDKTQQVNVLSTNIQVEGKQENVNNNTNNKFNDGKHLCAGHFHHFYVHRLPGHFESANQMDDTNSRNTLLSHPVLSRSKSNPRDDRPPIDKRNCYNDLTKRRSFSYVGRNLLDDSYNPH